MVPYFEKHGEKQYLQSKPIKFRFKLWVMGTTLGYCIRFRPYAGKDSILQENENIGLGLRASVVANLVSKPPLMQTSKYHIVMDNYFTSPGLLRYLSLMEVAATGTVRANRMKNTPLRDMVKIKKRESWIIRCGYWCVLENRTSLQFVGKIIKSWMRFPPLLENNQFNRSNVYCDCEKRRVNIKQPNIISQYNMYMGEMFAWIKVYRCISLTYTQKIGGDCFLDLLLIMFSKYIADPT